MTSLKFTSPFLATALLTSDHFTPHSHLALGQDIGCIIQKIEKLGDPEITPTPNPKLRSLDRKYTAE